MENKRFSDSYLENNGVDAHEVKEDYGCSPFFYYDIYNGETVTIRDKEGNLYADTEMSKDDFFDFYGNEKGEEK